MTFTKAIEVLKTHQKWRLGELDEMPFKPSEITEALDILLLFVEAKVNDSKIEGK